MTVNILPQFVRRRFCTLNLFCIFLVAASTSQASGKHTRVRSFDGVTASFEIRNPVIRIGDDLKVMVSYENIGHRTVVFNFFRADEKAEICVRGKSKPLLNIYTGEPRYSTVTLKPGERIRFEEPFGLKGWPDLVPGDYEIGFFYHLRLLDAPPRPASDASLVEKYRKKYPVDPYDLVSWGDGRHRFTITK